MCRLPGYFRQRGARTLSVLPHVEISHWVVELLEELAFFFCVLISILKAAELIRLIASGFGAWVLNVL